jgi:hypothetical protein
MGFGVFVSNSSDVIVRRNNIHPGYVERLTEREPFSGAYGIYVYMSQRVNVAYNRCFWSTRNLYLYFTTDSRADHNTFADSVYANISLPGDNPGAVITNNIAVGSGNDQIALYRGDYKWQSDYNCLSKTQENKHMASWDCRENGVRITRTAKDLAEWQKELKLDAHSVFADPNFVDQKKGDFRLKEGSPCIKAGENGTNIGAL